MEIPSALIELLLRKLPPLPPDPDPAATWSDTSATRQRLRSLVQRVITGMAGPLVAPLQEVSSRYLSEASDAQLAWVVDQVERLALELNQAAYDDDHHHSVLTFGPGLDLGPSPISGDALDWEDDDDLEDERASAEGYPPR